MTPNTTTDPQEQALMQAVVEAAMDWACIARKEQHDKLLDASLALKSYRAKSSSPEPARCEPPEELREHQWHWITTANGNHVIREWGWQENIQESGWLATGIEMGWSAEEVAAKGWRYHSPCLPDTRTEKEQAAIMELMQSQELSEAQVIRQALAHYQTHVRRLSEGETFAYSGDRARIEEFTGMPSAPLDARTPATDEAIDPIFHEFSGEGDHDGCPWRMMYPQGARLFAREVLARFSTPCLPDTRPSDTEAEDPQETCPICLGWEGCDHSRVERKAVRLVLRRIAEVGRSRASLFDLWQALPDCDMDYRVKYFTNALSQCKSEVAEQVHPTDTRIQPTDETIIDLGVSYHFIAPHILAGRTGEQQRLIDMVRAILARHTPTSISNSTLDHIQSIAKTREPEQFRNECRDMLRGGG